MDKKPLIIPQGKKIKGLKVWCRICRTNVADICKKSGKSISACQNGNKHEFKMYVHEPGTNNTRRTKTFQTRDIIEAIRQALEFEREVKNGNTTVVNKIISFKKETSTENIPTLTGHVLSRYIGFLLNESVPLHMQKQRSKEHIAEIKHSIKLFALSVKGMGLDVISTSISDINDEIVGNFYDYLLNHKGYSANTINRRIGQIRSCINWYNEEFGQSIPNRFNKVKKIPVSYNPDIIEKDEFEALLKNITHENGYIDYKKGVKKIRNIYRPWLKDAYRLALETGRRREEVINIKYSDVVVDADGVGYVICPDLKVNRIQNRTTEAKKKVNYIPLTDSLKQLLEELKTKDHSMDDYVLAPGIKAKRNRIMSDVMSRGFSHFYDQLGTGKHKKYACLRKTYITNMELFTGGNAKEITGHSSNKVVNDHYVNKPALAKAAKKFKVFGAENRKREMETIRSLKARPKKSLER